MAVLSLPRGPLFPFCFTAGWQRAFQGGPELCYALWQSSVAWKLLVNLGQIFLLVSGKKKKKEVKSYIIQGEGDDFVLLL